MESISRRQFFLVGTAATFAALGLAGCSGGGQGGSAAQSGGFKDGTYTGESSVLDAGVDGDGYGVISITIENGAIVEAKFQPFQVDGMPKDKDYGKDGANYAVAQKVVSAGDEYSAALIEAGSVDGVDVITGATFLHEQFVEAAKDALSKAK